MTSPLATDYRSWPLFRYAPAAALAIVWLSTAVLQRVTTPMFGAEIAMLVVVTPLTFWALTTNHSTVERIRFLAIAALPLAFLFVASLRSVSPSESLLGTAPHWHGWLLWMSLLAWLWAVVTGSRRNDLSSVVNVLAVAGTITAGWAIAEAFGILTTYDSASGDPAALFDSSLSLGQGLIVTMSATIAVATRRSISTRLRWALWASALMQLVAMFAADARGALVGVAMGIVAFGVTETRSDDRSKLIFRTCVALAVVFFISLTLVAAVQGGYLGTNAYDKLNTLLSDRLGVWQEVGEAMAGHELMGKGAAGFETIVKWAVQPDGSVVHWVTYTEHSILLAWLLSTGVVGVAAFAFAAAAVGLRFVRTARHPGASMPVRVMVAGGAATFVAMLSAWPDPLTLVSITVVAGLLISLTERAPATARDVVFRSRLRYGFVAVTIVATLLALHAFWPYIQDDITVAQQHYSHSQDHEVLYRAHRLAWFRTRDPYYIYELLSLDLSKGDAAVTDAASLRFLQRLAADYPAEAESRTDIPALAAEVLWRRRDSMSPELYWSLSQFYIAKGQRADSDDGIWPYLSARAAHDTGRLNTPQLIARAFDTTQPQSAQSIMVRWEYERLQGAQVH